LAANATTFTLGEAPPDAELLAVGEGILKTVFAHDTATAHFFGLTGGCTAFGEEEIGVDAKAVRIVLPGPFVSLIGFVSHKGPPAGRRCPDHENQYIRFE
jgi:hypothetical protein